MSSAIVAPSCHDRFHVSVFFPVYSYVSGYPPRASSLSLEQLRPLLSARAHSPYTTYVHHTRPREIIPLAESYVLGRKSRETDSQGDAVPVLLLFPSRHKELEQRD